MRKLLVNALITPDGTRLESLHRHHYVSHKDKNGETYATDGGLDYIRRSLNDIPATDDSVFSDDPHEKIREKFKWGTRGKSGNLPVQYVPLCELETSHIKAILKTQKHIEPQLKKVFEDELNHRRESSYTKEKIAEWLEDNYPDEEFLLADGFEEAFTGVISRNSKLVTVYDRQKCIEILMKDMSEDDAYEYFSYNVDNAYLGENTPVYLENYNP